jgi:aminopeptidase C
MPHLTAQFEPPDSFTNAYVDKDDAFKTLYRDMSKIAFGNTNVDVREFARRSMRSIDFFLPPVPSLK